MKIKIVFCVALCVFAIAFSSCSKKESALEKTYDGQKEVQSELQSELQSDLQDELQGELKSSPKKVDLDLTKLSATVLYGEIFNMLVEPERYEGKIIRMKGMFSVYEDDSYDSNLERVYACVIQDATACCAEGLEFRLAKERSYPSDFPELYSTITVVGEYFCEEHDGVTYTGLRNAYFE